MSRVPKLLLMASLLLAALLCPLDVRITSAADKAEKAGKVEAAAGTRLQKARLRIALRMKANRGDAKTKEACQKVLANDELFDATFEGLHAEYMEQAGGPLQDFFQWILEHFDEILAMILKLIPLFVDDGATIGPSPFIDEGVPVYYIAEELPPPTEELVAYAAPAHQCAKDCQCASGGACTCPGNDKGKCRCVNCSCMKKSTPAACAKTDGACAKEGACSEGRGDGGRWFPGKRLVQNGVERRQLRREGRRSGGCSSCSK